MKARQRAVAGTILKLRCQACGAVFPHFLFSGERDTDTAGLFSASSCNTNEVVVAEAEIGEWNDFAEGDASPAEKRLSQQLGRDDLKVIRLLRVEPTKSVGAGMNFREFRSAYTPPVVMYSCACCGEGESRAVEEMRIETFQESGGKILPADGLILLPA